MFITETVLLIQTINGLTHLIQSHSKPYMRSNLTWSITHYSLFSNELECWHLTCTASSIGNSLGLARWKKKRTSRRPGQLPSHFQTSFTWARTCLVFAASSKGSCEGQKNHQPRIDNARAACQVSAKHNSSRCQGLIIQEYYTGVDDAMMLFRWLLGIVDLWNLLQGVRPLWG